MVYSYQFSYSLSILELCMVKDIFDFGLVGSLGNIVASDGNSTQIGLKARENF